MSSTYLKLFTAIVVSLILQVFLPAAQAASTIADAILYGKVSGELRYRFENVDQDGFSRDANASTLRTHLGYTTDSYQGFGVLLEFENVSVIGSELYNSTVNGLIQYPVVADPDGTEVNQAYLSYESPFNTILKYGRQGINLDNQRFIGTVNFRQNEQTFDAFSLVNASLPDTTATYAHITNVNRVFGEDNPNPLLSDTDMSSDIVNVGYKGFTAGTLVGYGYLLDFEKTEPLSQKTFGLRFDGGHEVLGRKLLYTAEYANQSDYADGADTNDADYYYLALGTGIGRAQIKLNYEVLGGNGVYGFATPLATLHAFNGWADLFLATPKDGLRDTFASVSSTLAGLNLLAIYHDFSSDNDSYNYGTEVDLSVAKKVNKLLTLSVQYAAYFGDDNATNASRNPILSTDVDKLWLTADLQF